MDGGGESGFVRRKVPVLGLRGKTGSGGLFERLTADGLEAIRVSLIGRKKMGDGERTSREASFGAIRVELGALVTVGRTVGEIEVGVGDGRIDGNVLATLRTLGDNPGFRSLLGLSSESS